MILVKDSKAEAMLYKLENNSSADHIKWLEWGKKFSDLPDYFTRVPDYFSQEQRKRHIIGYTMFPLTIDFDSNESIIYGNVYSRITVDDNHLLVNQRGTFNKYEKDAIDRFPELKEKLSSALWLTRPMPKCGFETTESVIYKCVITYTKERAKIKFSPTGNSYRDLSFETVAHWLGKEHNGSDAAVFRCKINNNWYVFLWNPEEDGLFVGKIETLSESGSLSKASMKRVDLRRVSKPHEVDPESKKLGHLFLAAMKDEKNWFVDDISKSPGIYKNLGYNFKDFTKAKNSSELELLKPFEKGFLVTRPLIIDQDWLFIYGELYQRD